MLVARACRFDAAQAEEIREQLLLLEVVLADALDAELQREFQPGERLDAARAPAAWIRARRRRPGANSRRIRARVGEQVLPSRTSRCRACAGLDRCRGCT